MQRSCDETVARCTLITMLVLGLTSCASVESGSAGKVLAGAGQAAFGADLDTDGNPDGSYFGLVAELGGAAAKGHFVCAMWGKTKFMDLPLMGVEGRIQSADMSPDGSVSLEGTGTVDMGSADKFFEDVPFKVRVMPGGPGTGSLQLTVIGSFDGAPGDIQPDNGNYDMPEETVASGQIVLR